LPVVKSKILDQLYKSYPNFKKKDLSTILDIFLREITISLKKNERVELRGFGVFFTNKQKSSIRRNPKTGEKVEVAEKKTIQWKMSKEMFNKLNNSDD